MVHVMQLANFFGPTSGGIRVALEQLGLRYVEQGHRTTLVVPGAADGIEMSGNRTVIQLRSPLVPGLGGYRAIVARRSVRAAVAAFQPDVIELSDKTTLVGVARWARRRGVPTVLVSHEHTLGVVDQALGVGRVAAPAIAHYNRRLARHVDAVVCASDYAASEFGPDVAPAQLVHRCPLGVDLTAFRPAVGPRRVGPVRIVTAVRLSPEKLPDTIVATSRHLVDLGIDHEYRVFGEGPERARLERSAGGLPIVFEGYCADRTALARAMADADVGVAPGPHETFGLAAIELLAGGTPVGVPDHGALSEMVDDRTGVVAAAGDGRAIAAGVAALVRGERCVQRRLARDRAGRFSWERAADRFLAVHAAVAADACSWRIPAVTTAAAH